MHGDQLEGFNNDMAAGFTSCDMNQGKSLLLAGIIRNSEIMKDALKDIYNFWTSIEF